MSRPIKRQHEKLKTLEYVYIKCVIKGRCNWAQWTVDSWKWISGFEVKFIVTCVFGDPRLQYFLRILYFALFLNRRFYKSSLLAAATADNFRNVCLLISQEFWVCVMSSDVTADLIWSDPLTILLGAVWKLLRWTDGLPITVLTRQATSHITWSVPTQSTQSNYTYCCNDMCQSLDCRISSYSSGK
jgi:hypothetical protein